MYTSSQFTKHHCGDLKNKIKKQKNKKTKKTKKKQTEEEGHQEVSSLTCPTRL